MFNPRLDPRNLEIRTNSLEQRLVPFVSQISALVNYKEKYDGKSKNEKHAKAVMKVGSAVQAAVERFVTVGETIADENPDIQPEMYEACTEARSAGSHIACIANAPAKAAPSGFDKQLLMKSARQLLSSVTRVLLLADRVLIKSILLAQDKVSYSLTLLESSMNFTDFVKFFTQFGADMVDLAHKTGERQHDLKSEKRRAQMHVARMVLEKYTLLLLASSKTLLRHYDCESARQMRDGVFRQMRLALQLIGLCICDGIMPFDPTRFLSTVAHGNPHQPHTLPPGTYSEDDEPLDIGLQLTANVAIRHLLETLEMVRVTGAAGPGVRERLITSMDSVSDVVQDFTDSAYTAHHHREQIIDLLEETKIELSGLLKPEMDEKAKLGGDEAIETNVHRILKCVKDLRKQLQIVALDQVGDVFGENADHVILSSIKTCSVAGDIDGVETFIEKFREHAEHLQEVCRLLHHISVTDSLHVTTGHSERNLRALAPLIILGGRTLSLHPSSKVARENLEIFCDTWAQGINELSVLAKEADGACHGRAASEKQSYMSLPKPGKHGKTVKTPKPITLDVEDQAKMQKVGLEMKMITSEMEVEAEKWDEYSENEIVRRAKNMTSMAYNMYLFTRGDGPLKTTHDLFTQAEFFAEEANKMFKSVREFSYEVPGSAEKNELLNYLEKIPSHCQQLQVLVKSPTVGKTATFTKVDNVIQETKNLMNEITKLVTYCFLCARKFDIEFRSQNYSHGSLSGRSFNGGSSEGACKSGTAPMMGDGPWRRTPSKRSTGSSHHRSAEAM